MKKITIMMLVVFCATLTAGILPASAAPAKGLFVYWRGETPCGKGVKEGLKEQGVEFSVSEFNAERDKKKLDAFLAELDETQYDFIYTFGTTVSVKTAAKVKNTPIIFGIVTNPVKSGLIKSWESSGNNVTGVSHAIPYKDQVELILGLGDYKKIGMVFNPEEKNAKIAKAELEQLLQAKGVGFYAAPTASEADIPGAISKLVAEKADLVYLPSDSFVRSQTEKIVGALNEKKIPTYGALKIFVDKGAMIGIVSSYHAVGKEASMKVAQVLQGKKPSEVPANILPFEQQTILLNGKTVDAIGAELAFEMISQAQIIE